MLSSDQTNERHEPMALREGLAECPGTEINAGGDALLRLIADRAVDRARLAGSAASVPSDEALPQSESLSGAVLNSVFNAIIAMDASGHILEFNGAAEQLFGYSKNQVVGKASVTTLLKQLPAPAPNLALPERRLDLHPEPPPKLEILAVRGDGTEVPVELSVARVMTKAGPIFTALIQDIRERKRTELQRSQMETQLRQAQKLEAIGQLAAGIAHEINTPTQYVGDNTRFLQECFTDLGPLLRHYAELVRAARAGAVTSEQWAEAEKLLKKADLDYLLEQIPTAIKESLEGVTRVAKIVRAMKEFSHPGSKDKAPLDIHRAIESTVTVARNEWKYVAEMAFDFEPELPLVPCYAGEFSQVILNLVVNAAHAIGDVTKTEPGRKGQITIQTRRMDDWVEIRLSDSGTGIPESLRARIFEPFFTTKEVGKGTGQGLAMVYGTIVNQHNGTIRFETETGKGTTFILRLPLSNSGKESDSGRRANPSPGSIHESTKSD